MNGVGVPKDDVRAYAWANVFAAKLSTQESGKTRDYLENSLTPEQRAQGQKLSAELFAKMPKK